MSHYQPRHARPRSSQAVPITVIGVTAASILLPFAVTGTASAAAMPGISVIDVTARAAPQAPAAPELRARHAWHEKHLAHERRLAYLRTLDAPPSRARRAGPAAPDGRHAAPPPAVRQVRVTETAPAASTGTPGAQALAWAETQAGAPYTWGGTGPYGSGYDCSGLVQAAFARAGIDLPRTTWEMLRSPHLTQVQSPQRGGLVFLYGGEHVEFATMWPYTTFGAHSGGSAVSWLNWGWSGTWPPGTTFYSVH